MIGIFAKIIIPNIKSILIDGISEKMQKIFDSLLFHFRKWKKCRY